MVSSLTEHLMRSILRLLVTMAVSWSAAEGQFMPQGGKLIGSRSLGIANQGASLSLSGDGNTAIVVR